MRNTLSWEHRDETSPRDGGSAMTAMDPVAELVANVREPFENARAMPRSVYTTEAFLQRELKDLFDKEWVCVGRASSLSEPGDYLTYELAGQPIIVLRDREGNLRAMS